MSIMRSAFAHIRAENPNSGIVTTTKSTFKTEELGENGRRHIILFVPLWLFLLVVA